jgi:hypothetical protein
VIDPLTPATLYAGICDGRVFKSTNGAGNWSPFYSRLTNTRISDLAIDPLTPTLLYAATRGLGVFSIQQVMHRIYLPLVRLEP